MAEKRKTSNAQSGAKRIKALFSSFIRKEPNNQDKDNSSIEETHPVETSAQLENQGISDTTDGVSPAKAKPMTPSRRSFRPLDAEDFFQRVETFTAFGWFAKPTEVSPLQCARYGWENIDTDCLKCVSCREIFYGGLPAIWETESYTQACDKLTDTLKTAHSKICPWADNPSPESYLHIPLGDIRSSVEDFFSRVDDMHTLGDDIPNIDWSALKEQGWLNIDNVKSALLKAIAERGDSPDIVAEGKQPVWLAVCLLAVFGWQKSQSQQTGCPVLVCKYCRRQAGLWNFVSVKEVDPEPAEVTSHQEETDREPQAKRIKDIEKSLFNPATEHRTWCPWIRTSPVEPIQIQRSSIEPVVGKEDSEPVAGLSWQQLLIILLKRTDPETYGALASVINKATTPPSQTWKAVRRILNIWQSKDTAVPPPKQTTDTRQELKLN